MYSTSYFRHSLFRDNYYVSSGLKVLKYDQNFTTVLYNESNIVPDIQIIIMWRSLRETHPVMSCNKRTVVDLLAGAVNYFIHALVMSFKMLKKYLLHYIL